LKLFVFDLDNTLYKGNCSLLFFKFLFKKRVFGFFSLFLPALFFLRYQIGLLSVLDLHKKIFKNFLSGKNLQVFQAHVSEFLDLYLMASLNTQVIQHLKESQLQGEASLLLSSSPEFLVRPIAERLNIQMIQATEYVKNDLNQLSEFSIIIHGEEKAKFLQKIAQKMDLKKEDLIGYSDSYDDLPFLKNCGTVYLVNPDRKLKAAGLKYGWKTM